MTKLAMIMAGGTGGHVFPALAVARELSTRGWRIHWLGGNKGIETRAVPEAGYPMSVLGTQALRGQGLVGKLAGALALATAMVRALRVLRRERPQVVVSLGGYTAGPGGLAARLLGIPLVLHEQNAVAGLTNKVLARFAAGIAQAFPNTLPGGTTTGNPVRAEILALPTPQQRELGQHSPIRLLVFGGSQGAQALNQAVPAALADTDLTLDVLHQAGRGKAESTLSDYDRHQVQARVVEFVDDMAEAYCWADLVIGRSGALTVSEIAAVGVPAILVPLPIAVDDHQTANGRWLERAGAGEILPQNQLAEQLPKRLTSWCTQPELLQAAADRGRALATSDATERLADLIESHAHV